ncbi:pyridoxine/pyridoxamine 5'-phosphate oxidase, partial [Flavobacterium sp.]|uniref:pyridoxine/pyridoxamine 5'-phosphate oxidase n=2 Tax=Flavobacterium TaxID=237 RepID=UPI0040486971
MKDLSNYRKSYEKSELLENQIPEDPINLFHKWFFEAEDLNAADEVNAMTVSTIGLDGYPKSRVVLLKKFNEEGFIFYTNYNSEKGKAILNNPNVCLSFFWPAV